MKEGRDLGFKLVKECMYGFRVQGESGFRV